MSGVGQIGVSQPLVPLRPSRSEARILPGPPAVLSALNFDRYGLNKVYFKTFAVFFWALIVEDGGICGRFWFAEGT